MDKFVFRSQLIYFNDIAHLNFHLLQLAWSRRLPVCSSPPTNHGGSRTDELLHRWGEANLIKQLYTFSEGSMSREGSLETSTHRNNVRLVDHRLVKSQQGDVILECDGIKHPVFLFAF